MTEERAIAGGTDDAEPVEPQVGGYLSPGEKEHARRLLASSPQKRLVRPPRRSPIERARAGEYEGVDLSVVEAKRCSKCGEFKEAAAFRPNPRLKSGLDSWCSACRDAYLATWKADDVDARRRAHRATGPFRENRVCSECSLPFTARSSTATVCSAECRRTRKRRVARETRATAAGA
jgi:hypothetical protein